jgi:Caudovirales tail fibre assembly protein.
MSIVYVRFTDETHTAINGVFGSPQDPEYWDNLGELEDDDPRYLAYMNPPPDYLSINSAALLQATQLAVAQKTALTNRISTLNDAIELEMATPEEVAELPVRTLQLKQWKTYAILLGRVTTQSGWYTVVEWPAQPAEGMDLTVSAVSPETV